MYCKIENNKIVNALDKEIRDYIHVNIPLAEYVADPLRIKIIDNIPHDIFGTDEHTYLKLISKNSGFLLEALNKLQEDYQTALDKKFECYEYKAKANFKTKYTEAYTACLDDIEDSKEAIVNISIYNSEDKLENMDMDFENFKLIYRIVKEKAREIEKIYQQGLAEMSNIENLLKISSPEELIGLAPGIEQSLKYFVDNNLFDR